MATVISVENLSKTYRLGQIGTGTFTNDLKLWWAKVRGKPNPLLRIGETDHGNRDGEELWALKDVSFTVEQGEVLGIIGRNGAGKSTLLKILSRVTAPTSGKVKVKGRIASLLEVGTGFHPELTGRENIYLNGAILGMSRKDIDRKFDEIVDFSEIDKFIDTPVKRYSSGMYVRLAFAVAAHLEPEILLVDEVLAVGDVEFQKKCLGKMGEVAREGRTVLFVSHNMPMIQSLTNRTMLFSYGALSDYGVTQEIINKYLDQGRERESSEYFVKNSVENKVRFNRISLLGSDGSRKSSFFMNEPLLIEFEISIPVKVNNLNIGMDIISPSGLRIATAATWMKNQRIIINADIAVIRLMFTNIRLSPGKYHLAFGLYQYPGTHYDFIKDVVSFNIEPVDVIGTGHLPTGLGNQAITWFDYSFAGGIGCVID